LPEGIPFAADEIHLGFEAAQDADDFSHIGIEFFKLFEVSLDRCFEK